MGRKDGKNCWLEQDIMCNTHCKAYMPDDCCKLLDGIEYLQRVCNELNHISEVIEELRVDVSNRLTDISASL